MTGKNPDFNKTVKVCVMKVYTILMQVTSVKNDLDLASILHISLLCDELFSFYQNNSCKKQTNVSVAEQQLIFNNPAFYLYISSS